MLSKRLTSITKFIDKDDEVVDVGCDHGLLSIYLYENKLCKRIIASDVNKNALNNAISNINKKNLDIETVLSDGIVSVNMKNINTLVISGMGTSTILHILSDSNKLENVTKIVLQSNNEHSRLRKDMNKLGYYLLDEDIIYENKKYYVTMNFEKSTKKNSKSVLNYGIVKKEFVEYYKYLENSLYDILVKIPKKRVLTRIKLKLQINKYKNNVY